MAGNSSLIKRWAMVLVPVVAAFGKFGDVSNATSIAPGIAGCITLIFMWCLDVYYLRLEQAYVKLYEAIVAGKDVRRFDLDPDPYLDRFSFKSKAMRSKSVLLFYPPLLAALIVALVVALLFSSRCLV